LISDADRREARRWQPARDTTWGDVCAKTLPALWFLGSWNPSPLDSAGRYCFRDRFLTKNCVAHDFEETFRL